jgi:hypothetical protein
MLLSALPRALLLLAIPAVAFVGGSFAIAKISGREYVMRQLRPAGQTPPLNQRIRGYDAAAFDRYWNVLDGEARARERYFLKLDLVFPVLYGGALAAALVMARGALGRPFHAAWLVVPVVLTVAADWTENLVQLDQASRHVAEGRAGLQPGWMQIASAATMVKLGFFALTCVLLLALAAWLVVRRAAPAS